MAHETENEVGVQSAARGRCDDVPATSVDGTGHAPQPEVLRTKPVRHQSWVSFLTPPERARLGRIEADLRQLRESRRRLSRERKLALQRGEHDTARRLFEENLVVKRRCSATSHERGTIVNRCAKRRLASIKRSKAGAK